MKNQNNLGNILGTVGLVGGIFYAMKGRKSLLVTTLFGLGFGIGGMFIGNNLNKVLSK